MPKPTDEDDAVMSLVADGIAYPHPTATKDEYAEWINQHGRQMILVRSWLKRRIQLKLRPNARQVPKENQAAASNQPTQADAGRLGLD